MNKVRYYLLGLIMLIALTASVEASSWKDLKNDLKKQATHTWNDIKEDLQELRDATRPARRAFEDTAKPIWGRFLEKLKEARNELNEKCNYNKDLLSMDVQPWDIPFGTTAFRAVHVSGYVSTNDSFFNSQQVHENLLLEDGYTVYTYGDSNVTLVFSNGVVLILDENSALQVTKYLKQPDFGPSTSETILNLYSGSLLVNLTDLDDASLFTVNTPAGTAIKSNGSCSVSTTKHNYLKMISTFEGECSILTVVVDNK